MTASSTRTPQFNPGRDGQICIGAPPTSCGRRKKGEIYKKQPDRFQDVLKEKGVSAQTGGEKVVEQGRGRNRGKGVGVVWMWAKNTKQENSK